MAPSGIDASLITQPWLPGSFTKNFSWGDREGLRRLHTAIRLGFGNEFKPVERGEFRKRIQSLPGSSLIPLNFFLFNYIEEKTSFVAVDELVFQALTTDHSDRFDNLAVFAFNFSFSGTWSGVKRGQNYPALWARSYVIERVAKEFNWDVTKVSADDIQRFLLQSGKFEAKGTRKVATNLAYFYKIGGLSGFSSTRIERWWVDALFLALDRMELDRRKNGSGRKRPDFAGLVLNSSFRELAGPVTGEKTFAVAHLISLYAACGDLRRFYPDVVRELVAVEVPDYHWAQPNSDSPVGAVHPTNPRILKTVPRSCTELAEKVGFRIIPAHELETYDPREYGALQLARALGTIKDEGIKPTMSAEELHKLTRDE